VSRALPTVAFVGDESLVLQCASMARSAGHHVAAVASRRAEIRDQATSDGFFSVDSEALLEALLDAGADVLFSIANEFVLSDEVLAQVDMAINFHDGPLPDYAGLAVTTWSLFRGEAAHGVTWHAMTSEVDAGAIVCSERFEISSNETAFSLNARCYEAALNSFPTVLSRLTTQVGPFATQPDRSGAWFGRYQRPLVFLDPSKPAIELDRGIRALDLGSRIANRVGTVRLILGDEALAVGASEAGAFVRAAFGRRLDDRTRRSNHHRRG
jgi:methionyl-tRNA formyltransferase